MSTMASVPAMHEDVEERTSQYQQPQGSAEDVGAMFAQQ
jgi:hypothetical protein